MESWATAALNIISESITSAAIHCVWIDAAMRNIGRTARIVGIRIISSRLLVKCGVPQIRIAVICINKVCFRTCDPNAITISTTYVVINTISYHWLWIIEIGGTVY